tara:strand:- start:16761 stop:16979 length:219 start_codon:yes stop_codon:yes gene_type:complete
MDNIIYINKDPIIRELDNSIDKASAKRMIAFKHFNNNLDMLDDYLNKNNNIESNRSKIIKKVKEKPQLEFSF